MIWTTYFTSKRDDRGLQYPSDSERHIRQWHQCLKALDLRGTIIADNLSPGFMGAHQDEHVHFTKVLSNYPWSTNDWRFVCYDALLDKSEDDFHFMTDLWDVKVHRNPYEGLKRGVLYVGDHGDDYKNPQLLWNRARNAKDQRLIDFLEKRKDERMVGAWLLGGDKDVVGRFLRRFVEMLEEINCPHINLNMLIYGYLAFEEFGDCMDRSMGMQEREAIEQNKNVVFTHGLSFTPTHFPGSAVRQ